MPEVHIPYMGDRPEDEAHVEYQLDLALSDEGQVDRIRDLLDVDVEAWSAETLDLAGLRALPPKVVVEWDDDAIPADAAATVDDEGAIHLRSTMMASSDVLRALAWWLEPEADRVAVRSALYATLLGAAHGRRHQDVLLATFERWGVPVEAEDLRLADPD
jgi:hypothetical protein